MASRRRRRARQGKRFGKKLSLLGGVFLLVCVIGLVLSYRAVRNYLKSEDFRELVTDRASERLEAHVVVEPFEWDGWTARTSGVKAYDTNEVQQINAETIEAQVNISAALGGTYDISAIRVRDVEVTADLTKERGEAPPVRKRERSFLADYLPDEYEVDQVLVERLRGEIITEAGGWSWDEASLEVEPDLKAAIYDIHLRQAEIKTPLELVPELRLSSAKARVADGSLFLLNSEGTLFKEATITAEGRYELASEANSWNIKGVLAGARCEELVSENWKQRLQGVVKSEFDVRGDLEHAPVIRGELTLDQGVLTALPVLDRIAAYANTARFRRLVFSEASLSYRYEGGRLELNKVRLASEGLVQVEGGLVISGRSIRQGKFQVGITPGTLAHLPGAETKVFQRGKNGLLWTEVLISGTLDEPEEDLSERLIRAAGLRMFEKAAGTGKLVLKYGTEALGGSVKKLLQERGLPAIPGVPEAADQLKNEVIQEGVGTLFKLFGGSSEK